LIEMRCSGCSGLLRVDDSLAGKHVKCGGCGTVLVVPSPVVIAPIHPPEVQATPTTQSTPSPIAGAVETTQAADSAAPAQQSSATNMFESCPNCGSLMRVGAACGHCGKVAASQPAQPQAAPSSPPENQAVATQPTPQTLGTSPPPPPSQRVPHQAQSQRPAQCAQCGAPAAEGQYCGSCGSRLDAPPAYVPSTDRSEGRGTDVCPDCGRKREEGSARCGCGHDFLQTTLAISGQTVVGVSPMVLPPLCVRCGDPDDGGHRFTRSFDVYPTTKRNSAAVALGMLTLSPSALGMLKREKLGVYYSLCSRCNTRRLRLIMLAVGIYLVLGFGVPYLTYLITRGDSVALVLGLALIGVGWLYPVTVIRNPRMVRVSAYRDGRFALEGTSTAFLDALREYDGPMPVAPPAIYERVLRNAGRIRLR